MKMKENLMAIYGVLVNDDDLLKLLYYQPQNFNDDPLSHPSITDWEIKKDLVKKTRVVNDLDNTEKCRVLMYPSRRRPQRNYIVADQTIKIDVFCHISYDDVDFRLAMICDRINELLIDKHITGVYKTKFVTGGEIATGIVGYVAYQLVYEIGSIK